MDDSESGREPSGISLSKGGLFYGLERRLGGQVSSRTRRIAFLVGATWVPLAVLSAIDGVLVGSGATPVFLADPAPHARFLLALPLLILAEGVVDGLLRAIEGTAAQAGLVPPTERSRYDAAVTELERRRDYGWVDPVLLALALGLTWWMSRGYVDAFPKDGASTWLAATHAEGVRFTLAGQWYAWVGIPIFQFLALRWTWRYLVWIGFVFRVSRLKMALEPTHPDRAGGLGIVAMAPKAFALVFMSGSVVLSGMLASELLHQGGTLAESRTLILGFVVGCLLVLTLPLTLFLGPLLGAKRKGLMQYGALGSRLTRSFREKWVDDPNADMGALLDSPDPSAVADYAGDYGAVERMRVLPVSIGSLIPVALLLLSPFVPLLFTERTVQDVLKRLTGMFF